MEFALYTLFLISLVVVGLLWRQRTVKDEELGHLRAYLEIKKIDDFEDKVRALRDWEAQACEKVHKRSFVREDINADNVIVMERRAN